MDVDITHFESLTLDLGSVGWTRVHLGRTLRFARHVSQWRPEPQFRPIAHVDPSCEIITVISSALQRIATAGGIRMCEIGLSRG